MQSLERKAKNSFCVKTLPLQPPPEGDWPGAEGPAPHSVGHEGKERASHRAWDAVHGPQPGTMDLQWLSKDPKGEISVRWK